MLIVFLGLPDRRDSDISNGLWNFLVHFYFSVLINDSEERSSVSHIKFTFLIDSNHTILV